MEASLSLQVARPHFPALGCPGVRVYFHVVGLAEQGPFLPGIDR